MTQEILTNIDEAEAEIDSAIKKAATSDHPARLDIIKTLNVIKEEMNVLRIRLGCRPTSWAKPH